MSILVCHENRWRESSRRGLAMPVNLLEELESYRIKNERLARIYELHSRLAEKLDLASMVEAFSIWLASYLEHELVAYNHYLRRRIHVTCSSHGPRRQQLSDAARNLIHQPKPPYAEGYLPEEKVHYLCLNLDCETHADVLVMFFSNPLKGAGKGISMMEEIMAELRGPIERALAYEDLYDQARRDSLTGLVNRRVFEERLAQEINNAQRYGHPLVLAGLDLDHFKAINDKLGHAEGDATLMKVASTLSRGIRDSDLLARVGGDEFSLILPNTEKESARHLTQRLCRAVVELGIQAPDSPPLGVSIGLSAYRKGLSLAEWNEEVDAALYRAKAAGRSRVAD
ncbi:MAG: GGDEF domain-containing protein [Magnetococcales bacterium]|nr:GGDEF domain-containing protein [Magnetococcales bacterium]